MSFENKRLGGTQRAGPSPRSEFTRLRLRLCLLSQTSRITSRPKLSPNTYGLCSSKRRGGYFVPSASCGDKEQPTRGSLQLRSSRRYVYRALIYAYVNRQCSLNFKQQLRHVGTHFKRQSPQTSRPQQRHLRLELVRPTKTSNPFLSSPRSDLRRVTGVKPSFLFPPLPNSRPRCQRNPHPRRAKIWHLSPL